MADNQNKTDPVFLAFVSLWIAFPATRPILVLIAGGLGVGAFMFIGWAGGDIDDDIFNFYLVSFIVLIVISIIVSIFIGLMRHERKIEEQELIDELKQIEEKRKTQKQLEEERERERPTNHLLRELLEMEKEVDRLEEAKSKASSEEERNELQGRKSEMAYKIIQFKRTHEDKLRGKI